MNAPFCFAQMLRLRRLRRLRRAIGNGINDFYSSA
jgi:hypothetical protein